MSIYDEQGLFRLAYADWNPPESVGVHWYRGGPHGSYFMGYVIGSESPGGASELPPPSLQNHRTITMYARRDEYTCHLCGAGVQMDSRAANYPDRRPSPDHLTPRFAGGTDLPANIRTAHLSCNKARRNLDLRTWHSLRDATRTHGGLHE